MKIAVSSTGTALDSTIDARFGRCPYFLCVNPATLEFEAIANANAEPGGGAGIQSAKLVAEKKVSVVLTGSCGPNALQVLEKAGIHVVTGVTGSVGLAVQEFTAGSLKPAPADEMQRRFSGKGGQGMGRGTRPRG
jgi:predicted Fe-Mo cluster-binding NifX family protein